jgi:hypothetical protein
MTNFTYVIVLSMSSTRNKFLDSFTPSIITSPFFFIRKCPFHKEESKRKKSEEMRESEKKKKGNGIEEYYLKKGCSHLTLMSKVIM